MDKEDVNIMTLCKDKLIYENPVLGLRDVIAMLNEGGRKNLTPSTYKI